MNEGNLVQNSQRTPNELREQVRNAGIASGEARRQKRRYKEIAEAVLSGQTGIESLYGNIKQMAQGCSENNNITIKDLMVISQIDKAIQGNTKSFEIIQGIIGENLKEKSFEPKTYSIQMQCRDCGKIFSEVIEVKA
ncbi:hypothetical protein AGMMS50233_04970 [Endomicrobiia bacterium]|nr:hypothetical protein AGMMS50233_04970 [Endomicrobiia bacterium]